MVQWIGRRKVATRTSFLFKGVSEEGDEGNVNVEVELATGWRI